MSKRRNEHYRHLPIWLQEYANSRTLDFAKYSEYHMRMMDGGYITLDLWTTGRYYVLQTDYYIIAPDKKITERGGEKGTVPVITKKALFAWLDQLFFVADDEVVLV